MPGPGAVVVTIIPGGGTFFTEGKDTNGPSFGNYDLGAGVTVNINRYVGIEGEVSGALGVSQNLQIGGEHVEPQVARPAELQRQPGDLGCRISSSVVPYVTGGVGGLSMFEKASLGINGTETFLTGNVGGGLDVVRRPLGTPRRLPVRRGPVQGRRAGLLRAGRRDTATASTAACVLNAVR